METPRSSLFSSFLGLVLFGGNRAYAFIVGRRDRSTVGKDSIPSAILVLVASAMLLTHLGSLYKQKYSVIVVKWRRRVRCHETYLLSGSLFLTPSWIVGAILNEESLRRRRKDLSSTALARYMAITSRCGLYMWDCFQIQDGCLRVYTRKTGTEYQGHPPPSSLFFVCIHCPTTPGGQLSTKKTSTFEYFSSKLHWSQVKKELKKNNPPHLKILNIFTIIRSRNEQNARKKNQVLKRATKQCFNLQSTEKISLLANLIL